MYEVRPLNGLFAIYLGERLVGRFPQGTATLVCSVLNTERERVVKYMKVELDELPEKS